MLLALRKFTEKNTSPLLTWVQNSHKSAQQEVTTIKITLKQGIPNENTETESRKIQSKEGEYMGDISQKIQIPGR